MSCTMENELTAYVDGELAAAERARVEAHLAGCDSCRATQALLLRTVAVLRDVPALEPSAEVRRQVLRRIDEQAPSLGARLLAGWRATWLLPTLAGTAAAAILAVALIRGPGVDPGELTETGGLELATNFEVVRDLDVVGLDSPDDWDVVMQLDALEATP
jgi:anti-sigma factor RsiW